MAAERVIPNILPMRVPPFWSLVWLLSLLFQFNALYLQCLINLLNGENIHENKHRIMEWFPSNFLSNTPQLPAILIG